MSEAIILAGGLGTRLRHVLTDVPKPMAPIHDKPFLAYLIQYLKTQGIGRVILSTHYLHEKIQAYFRFQFDGIEIQYSQETEALGTGGAIVNSLTLVKNKSQPVFVLNGDTFFKMDYQAMIARNQHAKISMALRFVEDCSRYGRVVVEDKIVKGFCEKGMQGGGYINAGVYLIQSNLFDDYDLPPKFSFENDFLTLHLNTLIPEAFIANDYFIDIGIPEDYQKAIRDFSKGLPQPSERADH